MRNNTPKSIFHLNMNLTCNYMYQDLSFQKRGENGFKTTITTTMTSGIVYSILNLTL